MGKTTVDAFRSIHRQTFTDLMRPLVTRQRARWLWGQLAAGKDVDDIRAPRIYRQATSVLAAQVREARKQQAQEAA